TTPPHRRASSVFHLSLLFFQGEGERLNAQDFILLNYGLDIRASRTAVPRFRHAHATRPAHRRHRACMIDPITSDRIHRSTHERETSS
ncbi:MAG TPA: hypothetical protein PLN35_20710, partial [Quisquiliibacterium sp.]|nr:hypothetical protein [Quisquiliibacterium sp.]